MFVVFLYQFVNISIVIFMEFENVVCASAVCVSGHNLSCMVTILQFTAFQLLPRSFLSNMFVLNVIWVEMIMFQMSS